MMTTFQMTDVIDINKPSDFWNLMAFKMINYIIARQTWYLCMLISLPPSCRSWLHFWYKEICQKDKNNENRTKKATRFSKSDGLQHDLSLQYSWTTLLQSLFKTNCIRLCLFLSFYWESQSRLILWISRGMWLQKIISNL